ncbi:MAG: response regulator [Planctomycetales bacterium]|nr:response regulator [Planctomycetales bacterium]NIM08136.1 response regulator [Planctomycetales bacterium]NIN07629.1 response regulator [Planctomycetales bacterium]NIN76746.1 response regulator [Planctomycetales bacterium]NIO33945.1 response regulator [Planctomycetales bacterium]
MAEDPTGPITSRRDTTRPIRRNVIADKSPKSLRILFADDEKSLQELMSLELPRLGHEVTVCPDGLTAVAALEVNVYDCILVDLDMPGLNGIQVIARAKALAPDTEAVVLTGKSSLETAVAALRQGAFDYLTKPCKLVELEALLARIADKRELQKQCRALQHQVRRLEGAPQLVGDNPAMQEVNELIAKVAPTQSTVLILGETGTGKELVARALHEQSSRAERPFVAINCGALPESLIESELFGHRKGAFTGADDHRTGLFEVADGGTLFLDEIGELPKSLQAKLLRFLESGEIRRVGENDAIVVDVRVLCATHRNLVEMVEEGTFREDLMFRINTFEIPLPSLRERLDDLPQLTAHLLARFRGGNSAAQTLDPQVLDALARHSWPGNVRELANVMEHASILAGNGPIGIQHLPANFGTYRASAVPTAVIGPISLRELEMQAIDQALDRHQGNKPKVAEELGISLKTLYNKLNQAILKEAG